jgi:DNA-binding response OmpR family regulator
MSKKILIIEDDKVTLTMLETILRKAQFQVFSAQNGEDGLSAAQREKPDLVITDLLIPKIDGIGVCDKIKKNISLQQTKVIIISAIQNMAIQREVKSCGADAFIEKPIVTPTLLTAIHKLLKPE